MTQPRYHQHSQLGRRGGVNEDRALAAPPFYGVADGVGGGVHGEVAAQAALECCAKLAAPSVELIRDQVILADREVRQAIAGLSTAAGATTLAALWLEGRRVTICHVGDARIYRLRPDWRGRHHLTRLTLDHTYENCAQAPPEGARPDDPCRMLGSGPVPEPDIARHRARGGDIYLLCTDGLHRYVTDQGLRMIIEQGLRGRLSLERICEQLAGAAAANDGLDDITMILLRIEPRWFLF